MARLTILGFFSGICDGLVKLRAKETSIGGDQSMRYFRIVILTCLLFAIVFVERQARFSVAAPQGSGPVIIHVGTLLDGKGGVQRDTNIVVQGTKIARIDSKAANPTYDLRTLTVMPGMIDTHVHISWHFGKDGRYEPRAESPEAERQYTIENLKATLMAGFTTVQSVGAPSDVRIRDDVATNRSQF